MPLPGDRRPWFTFLLQHGGDNPEMDICVEPVSIHWALLNDRHGERFDCSSSDPALSRYQRPSDSSPKPLSSLPNRNHREPLHRQHLASAGGRLAVVLTHRVHNDEIRRHVMNVFSGDLMYDIIGHRRKHRFEVLLDGSTPDAEVPSQRFAFG